MDNRKNQANQVKATMLKAKEVLSIEEFDFDNLFYDLTNKGDIDSIFNWQEFTMDLMKILSNPKVSSCLEDFYQDKAGSMLKKLHSFFWSMEKEYESSKYFLDSTKVTFFNDPGIDLNEINTYYQNLLDKKQ